MLKQKNYPLVYHSDNGVFKDYSFEALSFGRDTFPLAMVASEDYLYFGKEKPFPMFYVELGISNTIANTLSVEFYNGTTWESISGMIDDTKGFTRSGSIQWDEEQPTWAKFTVNSQEKYWIRLKPDADFSANTTVQGINIIFSDDQDLKGIYPKITNFLMQGEKTFILRHEAARDDIVQNIRNDGQAKLSLGKGRIENIEAWDFLQYEEVRRWATYLVMQNIFSSLQSTEDGMYKQKSEEYRDKAQESRNLFFLSLDTDDDGQLDETERTHMVGGVRFLRR